MTAAHVTVTVEHPAGGMTVTVALHPGTTVSEALDLARARVAAAYVIHHTQEPTA
ncbi:hypothetical protein G1H11_14240 [Phytoactinopolyspora alkaliphila]|uniref:Uncharacterized protein n=1 Tax=Phytoactinopolyspora alkaliphila TaxID=1783498 RepID=A0A6N9YN42_9ACTN|nr:hypothetical protein [Phytoactinopolyspora alkaliphila]NED96466.1 hypothetical protein [Phytoactinopolyspora alkaliphila]